MAIPNQLLNNLNKDFGVMVTQVTNHQTEFIASNPGYWQGMLNPPIIPADGNSETIVLTLSPTDQPFDWSWIVGHLPSTSIFSVEVDVHDGPLGKGFTLRGWVSITGDGLYFHSQGIGPYGVTTVGWNKLPVMT